MDGPKRIVFGDLDTDPAEFIDAILAQAEAHRSTAEKRERRQGGEGSRPGAGPRHDPD